jgi:hypothetical protein
VDRFVARSNIAHFEDLLARETDPEKRQTIERLLVLERQKLEAAEREAEKNAKTVQPPKPGDSHDQSD